MICNWCEKEKFIFARSHIIPKAFHMKLYAEKDKDKKYSPKSFTSAPDHFPKKSRQGDFDQSIICPDCEHSFFERFDDYGFKLFNGFIKNIEVGSLIVSHRFSQYDYLLTRNFILSWDGGMNQDIPILNLYTDPNTNNVVCNQNGGNYINFSVTFDYLNNSLSSQTSTFADLYGQPYQNTMLFSLPIKNMSQGVLGVLTPLKQGEYLLAFYDQQKPTANVLGFQKVYLNQNNFSINVSYLNNTDIGWNSIVPLAPEFGNIAIGKSKSFVLKSITQGNQNRLEILRPARKVAASLIKKQKNVKKKVSVVSNKVKKKSPQKVVKQQSK